MSAAAAIHVRTDADEIRELGRLAGSSGYGGMMLSHALCWLGRDAVGAVVRAAVKGRGTMLEERHRIEFHGDPGEAAGSEWDVSAEVAPSGPNRLVVRTNAVSARCGTLSSEVHLLALGDSPVPKARALPARPALALRTLAFTQADIDAYAALSGDDNALHMDAAAAQRAGLPGRVVHGALVAAAVEATVAEKVRAGSPLSLSVRFTGPVVALEPLVIAAREMGQHGGQHIVRAFASCGNVPVCTADLAFAG